VSNIAISNATPSTLETLLTPTPTSLWTVISGRAQPGQTVPFVAYWPITPLRTGQALATEDWGQAYSRWQINCFGESMATAQWLANQVLELPGWGDLWACDDIGPCLPDDQTDAPAWWFIPLTLRDISIGS
jgi:hypothetical protein